MTRRTGGMAWDVAPLLVLASAGVALLQEPRGEKRRRLQHGRGRHAQSPKEIPARGWKDILLRTKDEFVEDHVSMISAGVTFYILLALFPGMAAFVALYGLFADVHDVGKQLAALSFVLPPGTLTFVGDQMIRIAVADKGGQSFALAVGVLASIWSANGAVKALMAGLNIAYEEEERRSYLRRTLISLGFTLGFLIFGMAMIAVFAAPPAIETFLGAHAADLFRWISYPAVLASMLVWLALFYRFGPSRDPARWRWITWGSAAVLIFWILASVLFSLYVDNFAHYDKTYGSLGAVIGFMMWVYLSVLVFLAGAELNSEIEHQTAVDTTVGAPQPLGYRRATMADTVGRARSGWRDGPRPKLR